MSGYSQALDPVTQKGYFKKLSLLRLNEHNGPYAEARQHDAQLTMFTSFSCFIERPGVYNRLELMHWKNLEAFNP